MTSHELAKKLLDGPDVLVTVMSDGEATRRGDYEELSSMKQVTLHKLTYGGYDTKRSENYSEGEPVESVVLDWC